MVSVDLGLVNLPERSTFLIYPVHSFSVTYYVIMLQHKRIWYDVMRCGAVRCGEVWCGVVQCSAAQYSEVM